MFKVFIDPGHGGADSGAVGPSGTREEDITMEMADLLSLACRRKGWDIMWSRYEDKNVAEWRSADKANKWNADVYISLHANGAADPEVEGYEVLHWHTSEAGKRIAELIIDGFCGTFWGNSNRGVKPRKEGDRGQTVLSRTKMPAVIVESGFISNPREEEWLQDFVVQAQIADIIVKAIEGYFFKEEE